MPRVAGGTGGKHQGTFALLGQIPAAGNRGVHRDGVAVGIENGTGASTHQVNITAIGINGEISRGLQGTPAQLHRIVPLHAGNTARADADDSAAGISSSQNEGVSAPSL